MYTLIVSDLYRNCSKLQIFFINIVASFLQFVFHSCNFYNNTPSEHSVSNRKIEKLPLYSAFTRESYVEMTEIIVTCNSKSLYIESPIYFFIRLITSSTIIWKLRIYYYSLYDARIMHDFLRSQFVRQLKMARFSANLRNPKKQRMNFSNGVSWHGAK